MDLLSHNLSDDTVRLIEEAVHVTGGRLAIYAPHNWALEDGQRSRFFAFDPKNDSQFLRDELTRIIQRGVI